MPDMWLTLCTKQKQQTKRLGEPKPPPQQCWLHAGHDGECAFSLAEAHEREQAGVSDPVTLAIVAVLVLFCALLLLLFGGLWWDAH